ncbi:MAG: hypothetical protein IKC11_00705 [Clostridia bacterium]|nr:hypothetical protein [Clostridia bacterium]
MESINPKVKKKVKEIVGDSTGREAALKIAEYYNKKSSYRAYGAYPRCGKSIISELRQKNLNCSDIAPYQKEIDILTQMGFTPKQIIKILLGYMK